MVNFLRAFPQLRCTELQLNTKLASLQLKRVAQERSEGVWPFEVAGWPTECTISSDIHNCGHAQKKIYHRVLYGILPSTIRPAEFVRSLSLAAITLTRCDHSLGKIGFEHPLFLSLFFPLSLSLILKKLHVLCLL